MFGANYYLNSKKAVMPINISMSLNNVRKITGSKKWIVWTDPYSNVIWWRIAVFHQLHCTSILLFCCDKARSHGEGIFYCAKMQMRPSLLEISTEINAQIYFVIEDGMDTNGLHTTMDHWSTLLVPTGRQIWNSVAILVQNCLWVISMAIIMTIYFAMTR